MSAFAACPTRRRAIRDPRSYLFRTARNLALDHVKRSEFRLTAGTDIDELQLEAILTSSAMDPTLCPGCFGRGVCAVL